MILYCPRDGGFYVKGFHASIPDDVREISVETRDRLLLGQSEGKLIAADERGYPCLVDYPQLSDTECQERERAWRTEQLQRTDFLVSRHRDQLEISTEAALSEGGYRELLFYRDALRRYPQSKGFPLKGRPLPPTWLFE